MYPYYNGYPGTGNYNRYMPQGYPGRLSGMGQVQIYPHVNNLCQTEIWTITPPGTPTASTTYNLTINGVTVSATTDASPTALELGTALYNAFRLEAQLYGAIEPTLNTSTGVITLEVMGFAQNLVVSATAGIVAVKTVSATYGNIIPFGRFVGRKASYYRDPQDGSGTATLIDHASDYTLLGVTMTSYATERINPNNNLNVQALEGYPFGYVMNVLKDTGTCKGVWVETVEPDLAFGDPLYVAIGAGNEGKLTKTAGSNVPLVGKASLEIAANPTFGNRSIALISLHL